MAAIVGFRFGNLRREGTSSATKDETQVGDDSAIEIIHPNHQSLEPERVNLTHVHDKSQGQPIIDK